MPRKIGIVTRDILVNAPLPTATKTYTVITHAYVINLITKALEDNGFTIKSEEYKCTADAKVAHGVFVIDYQDDPDLEMIYTFSNSYDKSLRFRAAIGAQVLANGAFTVSDTKNWLRKHTGTADNETEELIKDHIENAKLYFDELKLAKEAMKAIEIDRSVFGNILGELFINRHIAIDQLSTIAKEYEHPNFTYTTGPNNLWTCFNHIAVGLRQSHPAKWMNNHINVHLFFATKFDLIKFDDEPETTIIDGEEVPVIPGIREGVEEAVILPGFENLVGNNEVAEHQDSTAGIQVKEDPAQKTIEQGIAEAEAEANGSVETIKHEIGDGISIEVAVDPAVDSIPEDVQEKIDKVVEETENITEAVTETGKIILEKTIKQAEKVEMLVEEVSVNNEAYVAPTPAEESKEVIEKEEKPIKESPFKDNADIPVETIIDYQYIPVSDLEFANINEIVEDPAEPGKFLEITDKTEIEGVEHYQCKVLILDEDASMEETVPEKPEHSIEKVVPEKKASAVTAGEPIAPNEPAAEGWVDHEEEKVVEETKEAEVEQVMEASPTKEELEETAPLPREQVVEIPENVSEDKEISQVLDENPVQNTDVIENDIPEASTAEIPVEGESVNPNDPVSIAISKELEELYGYEPEFTYELNDNQYNITLSTGEVITLSVGYVQSLMD